MITYVQYFLNFVEIAALYSLVACGFYLITISTRHFAFAAAIGFMIVPYSAVLPEAGFAKLAMILLGLALCGAFGFIYQKIAGHLSSKGAREGQLLIVSLAIMGIGENVVTLVFGSSSQTLSSALGLPSLIMSHIHVSGQQLTALVFGWSILILIVFQWRCSLIGKILQALVESRLNLALRGVSVSRVETWTAITGFIIVGVSGVLWAIDGRIKPAMCTEVGVVGAVSFIIGAMIKTGPIGLIVAATALAFGRLLLSLTLEGDWSMTAMLLVLGCTLVLKRRAIFKVESA